MSSELSVTIAVLTFRRPAELAACLPLLVEHATDTVHTCDGAALLPTVLVVDNDPAGSARPTVEALAAQSPVPMRYSIEPRAGIAAARNHALDHSTEADLLVFIDDDERPTRDWLAPLIDTWCSTGAAAVLGRVVSVFDSPLDSWVAAGEFFRRRHMPTGTELDVGAAGNMLLDLVQVRRLGVRFDERLGLAAGEDSLFTRQLVRSGGKVVWCEESVATDHVPANRRTRAWVLERARSHGNTETVVELLLAESPTQRGLARVRAVVRGCARMLAGSARFAAGLALRSRRHQARGLRTAYRGAGIAAGAAGIVVEEYARG